MYLNKDEMELVCILHAGTLSETLNVITKASKDKNLSKEKEAVFKSVIEKLSGMKGGDTVSLAFESK